MNSDFIVELVEEFNRQSTAIRPTNVERKPPARSEVLVEAKKKGIIYVRIEEAECR